MRTHAISLLIILASLLSLTLVSCGGGSSGESAPAQALVPPAAEVTETGGKDGVVQAAPAATGTAATVAPSRSHESGDTAGND